MKGREDDNEDYYYLVTETKLHNEQYFECENKKNSSNRYSDIYHKMFFNMKFSKVL